MSVIEAALPMSLDEVTAPWLTSVLSARYPGVVVTRLVLSGQIGGTATKVRLELEYNEAGAKYGLPASAWLKGGFETHVYAHAPTYIAEARFFEEWAPKMSINIPKSYWSGVDGDRQGLVLLEDLADRGATYGRSTNPLTPDQALAVMNERGKMHARFWNDPQLATLRSYTDRFAGANHFMDKLTKPEVYGPHTETARFATAPARLKDPQVYRAVMEALYAITDQGAQTLNQGDSHLGNVFFEADGTVGILDWQAYIRASFMCDTAYFLPGALTVEDRRRHEQDLLKQYLEGLKAQGVKDVPGWDEAWLLYRKYVIHGFAWSVTTVDFHPEDVIMAYAERYGAVAEDLETLKALGV